MIDQCQRSSLFLVDDEDESLVRLLRVPLELLVRRLSTRRTQHLLRSLIRRREMLLLWLLPSGLREIWIGCWEKIKREGLIGGENRYESAYYQSLRDGRYR
jgi:hypothetical protein